MSNSFIDDLSDLPGLNVLTTKSSKAPSVLPAEENMFIEDDGAMPKADTRPTFPCESCQGTGRYRGVRVHQAATECFACKGRGFHYKSRADRMATRAKRLDTTLKNIAKKNALFHEQNPGLIEGLRAMTSWNDFAASLVAQFDEKGGLSDKQIAAGQGQIDKAAARDAERAAAKVASVVNAPVVDMSKIWAMFNTAKSNGLNKLAFVAADLRISPAKSTSANAGCLYVQRKGDYQGKITEAGKFLAVREASPDTAALLMEIAVNPSQAARDYGKRTGRCCCCDRELTDPVSIANGIGPICATKWGL